VGCDDLLSARGLWELFILPLKVKDESTQATTGVQAIDRPMIIVVGWFKNRENLKPPSHPILLSWDFAGGFGVFSFLYLSDHPFALSLRWANLTHQSHQIHPAPAGSFVKGASCTPRRSFNR
jgi:hypothetical protein